MCGLLGGLLGGLLSCPLCGLLSCLVRGLLCGLLCSLLSCLVRGLLCGLLCSLLCGPLRGLLCLLCGLLGLLGGSLPLCRGRLRLLLLRHKAGLPLRGQGCLRCRYSSRLLRTLPSRFLRVLSALLSCVLTFGRGRGAALREKDAKRPVNFIPCFVEPISNQRVVFRGAWGKSFRGNFRI